MFLIMYNIFHIVKHTCKASSIQKIRALSSYATRLNIKILTAHKLGGTRVPDSNHIPDVWVRCSY
ncbi:hypothetical protein Hanom_Chr03g00211871 [Helianthus anomalus]